MTTRVSRHQKGKMNLDYIEARDSEWQWHELGNMQICTLPQSNNHASTPPLSFTGRPYYMVMAASCHRQHRKPIKVLRAGVENAMHRCLVCVVSISADLHNGQLVG